MNYINYGHEWVQSTSVKCVNSQLTAIIEILGMDKPGKKLKDRDFMSPLCSEEHLLSLIKQYTEIASKTNMEETRTHVCLRINSNSKLYLDIQ